jgi:glycosyl transferase family 25
LSTTSYLINLEIAKDRLEYSLPPVKALNFPVQIISAVYGKNLPRSEIEKKVDIESYKVRMRLYPGFGTIGCSLSHIKTWKIFLESDYEFALIFEDDVCFEPKQLQDTVAELTMSPGSWDICLFSPYHHGNPLAIKRLGRTNKNLCVYLTRVTQSGAYILNRKAATRLLANALPIKLPLDHYFTRAWEFGLIFTGVEPRIVDQNSFGDSYIAPPVSVYRTGDVSNIFRFKAKLFKYKTRIYRLFYALATYMRVKLMSKFTALVANHKS